MQEASGMARQRPLAALALLSGVTRQRSVSALALLGVGAYAASKLAEQRRRVKRRALDKARRDTCKAKALASLRCLAHPPWPLV